MEKKLDGKVAVITGGSSGIGFATARLFRDEGASVVITGRNQERLDSAAKELGVIGISSDSSVLGDIDRLYREVKEEFGNIDVLFLNAGVAPFVPLDRVSEEHFDSVMDINVKGVFFGVQKVLPFLNDGASIVINSSVVNQAGMAGASVYAASKAAVRSLARTMSAELVGKGIRVNVVSPGPIDTPIFSKVGIPEEQMKEMAEGITMSIPMKRFGRPEEVASVALFLACEDSSYMLGAELAVDGGMSQL